MGTVYLSMSADIIHGGHINIIEKAAALGELTVGVLTDQVVASYKRYPLLSYEERVKIIENIRGVAKVIPQDTLSYRKNLEALKPDYLVHGDNWKEGFQKAIRAEAVEVLASYGGILKEFPYSGDEQYQRLEDSARDRLSIPDVRRSRLKNLLGMKTERHISLMRCGYQAFVIRRCAASRILSLSI